MAYIDSVATLGDEETEVLYSIKIDIEGYGSYILEAYFPNKYHSQNKSMRGDEKVTYAQLAGLYLKFGSWSGWMDGEITDKSVWLRGEISKQVQSLVDEERREAKRQWNIALRKKGAKAMLREFENRRNELKEIIEHQRSIINKPLPKLSDNATYEQTLTFKTELNRAKEAVRRAKAEMSASRSNLASMGTLRDYKVVVASKFFSKDWKDAIAYTIKQMKLSEDLGDRRALKIYGEQLSMMTNPWDTAISVKNALQKARKELQNTLINILLGAKTPPLEDSTLKKRKYAGISSTIPLNETGEFAKSLKVRLV